MRKIGTFSMLWIKIIIEIAFYRNIIVIRILIRPREKVSFIVIKSYSHITSQFDTSSKLMYIQSYI